MKYEVNSQYIMKCDVGNMKYEVNSQYNLECEVGSMKCEVNSHDSCSGKACLAAT